ncbi:hypothetical protein ECP03018678_3235 [Escherichia coli P0301867.8]|nr:hypothetical protein ECP03018678_3235 [Escherichia coli P0301867.8]
MNTPTKKKQTYTQSKTHNNGINGFKKLQSLKGNGSTERANKTSETQSERFLAQ